jgi:hypothetical protein
VKPRSELIYYQQQDKTYYFRWSFLKLYKAIS